MTQAYFDELAHEWDSNPAKVERARCTADKIAALNFADGHSFVDFGCGTGLLGMQFYQSFTQVHLVDSSAQMLRVADEKISRFELDNVLTHHIDSLQQLPGQHSAIASLMVLHHIKDVRTFFIEAYQSLNPSGLLIIADLYREDGSFHKGNPDFDGHNGFDINQLQDWAASVGFENSQAEHYYDVWHENYAKQRVAYPLFLFVAQKPSIEY